MAIALVSGQVASNGLGSASAVTATLPVNPTTGNLVIACGVSGNSGATYTVTDSNSNSYTPTTSTPFAGPNVGFDLCIFYLANAPSNATKTITFTETGGSGFGQMNLWVAEFSGAATSTVFDIDVTGGSASSNTNVNSPSITASGNNELLIGCACPGSGITVATSPWTLISTVRQGNAAEYFIQSTAAAQAIGFTQSPASTWDGMAAAFKPAGAGAQPFLNDWDFGTYDPPRNPEPYPYRSWTFTFQSLYTRPFSQQDWPTPPPVIWSRSWEWRQVGFLGKDTLPKNQKDWPNPYPVVWYQHFEDGPLPNLYGRDFLPKNQKDWPNPYPVIWYRDWEDGPLPNLYGKDTLPKRQMDWPTPPPVVWYQEWHSDLLQTTLKPGVVKIPFLQFDWPNPQPVTWYRDWEDGPLPNLLGQDRLPNRQQDWPNPYPVQWYKTWESWYNLNLRGQDNLPFNQKDWPNPPPVQWFKDWSQSLLLQASQKAPFAQRDWPVPQGVLWYRDNGPPTTTPLRFAGAKPFKQTDWPFPQPVFWYRDSNFSTFNPRYPVIVVGTDLHFKPTQAMVGRLGNLGGIP